jgi:hypothetical protein
MLLTAAAAPTHHADEQARRGVDVNSIQITEQSLDLKYGAAYGATPGARRIRRCRAGSITSSSRWPMSPGRTTSRAAEPPRGQDRRQRKYGADLFMANRAILYTFNNQRPVSLQLLATPTHFEESADDIALYAQDQWTIRA